MVDISIIVPIYNASKYLKKCLDSLIGQSMDNLEFILINDGSSDNSDVIIKSYQDKRIKYIKQENKGIGATRNLGINLARGKYIMFLDSDDYLDKKACQAFYERINKSKLDVVVSNFYKDIDGIIKEEKLPSFPDTSLKDNKQLLLDINLAPWNKIYRTEFLKKNKILFVTDLKYEDAPFVLECLFKAKKIGKLDMALNYYVIHGNSETTLRDKRMFDIIKIMDIIRNIFKSDKEYDEVIDTLTIKILVNYTIQQRVNKNKKERHLFIDEVFCYLNDNVKDYRHNSYFKKRSFIKGLIEKNKILTKMYCDVYKK